MTISIGILVLILVHLTLSAQKKRALVWLCLERCGETHEEILSYLEVIKKKAPDCLTDVSYEKYDLGYNSTLVDTEYTDVWKVLNGTKGHGGDIQLSPMITTVNIEKMREVFDDPDPFIHACLEEAKKYDYYGYNIDFEPEKGVEQGDKEKYVKFLDLFSSELKKNGVRVSVDIATWSILWDYKSFNALKNLDQLITMETYVKTWESFKKYFDEAYAAVDHERFGCGLDSEWSDLKEEDFVKRFDYISTHEVYNVDIWRYITEKFSEESFWWCLLEDWIKK